jgi:ribosomal protein L11 methyltransferase
MEEVFGFQPVSYVDYETRAATVTIYSEQEAELSKKRRARLKSGLREIDRSELKIGSGRLSLARVRRQEWAESWKRHFKPIEIGKALLVKPSWSRRQAKAGQAVVVLDPGLSFGTGQHATTRFCLRELARLREARTSQALLDIGTGSGILAIAGTKLGYRPVAALDYDAEAVAIARANARRNRVEKVIRFRREDVTRPRQSGRTRYAVICANLIANVLLEARDRILCWLEPGGVVILAGILKDEFDAIRKSYEAAGARLAARQSEKEWCSASFMLSK